MRRIAVVLVGLAGCFGQKDTLGLPCQIDAHCDIGQACVQGECQGIDDATTMASDSAGCVAMQVDLAPVPPAIALVVDRSAAMNDAWDDDGDPQTPAVSRWPSLVAALGADLPALDGVAELGLVLAPSPDADAADACDLDGAPTVAIQSDAAMAMIDALPAMAAAGEPLGAALAQALADLQAHDGIGPRALVLVVAGAPNCGMEGEEVLDDAVVDAVAGALADGIPTVVVGVDPSTTPNPSAMDGRPDDVAPHDVAVMLAEAGGRPRAPDSYYRATNGVTLGPTLRDGLFGARDCVLARPDGIAMPSDVHVRIGEDVVPRIDACDGSGFVVDDGALRVCGTWCAALKLAGTAHVSIECG